MSTVRSGQLQQGPDVGVVEPVVDHPAVTAVADDPGGAQQSHRMGHHRLGHPDHRSQIADTQLTGVQQGEQDPYPVRLAQQLEPGGQGVCFVGSDETLPGGPDPFEIDDADVAVVGAYRFG